MLVYAAIITLVYIITLIRLRFGSHMCYDIMCLWTIWVLMCVIMCDILYVVVLCDARRKMQGAGRGSDRTVFLPGAWNDSSYNTHTAIYDTR
jgi:hypothetical protein